MKTITHIALAVVVGMTSIVPANAAERHFEVVPDGFLMQDYLNNEVVLWYTPSVCGSGLVKLSAQAPSDSKNRLWSVIMTAKLSGKRVGIYYDDQSCLINSFTLLPG